MARMAVVLKALGTHASWFPSVRRSGSVIEILRSCHVL